MNKEAEKGGAELDLQKMGQVVDLMGQAQTRWKKNYVSENGNYFLGIIGQVQVCEYEERVLEKHEADPNLGSINEPHLGRYLAKSKIAFVFFNEGHIRIGS